MKMQSTQFNYKDKFLQAVLNGDHRRAFLYLPRPEGQYQYSCLLKEFNQCLSAFYKAENNDALRAMLHLVARLPYESGVQEYAKLLSNAVAVIVEKIEKEDQFEFIQMIFSALPETGDFSYLASDGSLNYNLACYYAGQGDVKQMLEYIRRARFRFEPEKFMKDPSFDGYKDTVAFTESLEDAGYTFAVWWRQPWPIKEWFDS